MTELAMMRWKFPPDCVTNMDKTSGQEYIIDGEEKREDERAASIVQAKLPDHVDLGNQEYGRGDHHRGKADPENDLLAGVPQAREGIAGHGV